MSFITVRHNIEVAHRLYDLPGKCMQIHGHSMWVELKIHGHLDRHGVLGGLEFGEVKKLFRGYLDEQYDHRLLLNHNDPWSGYHFTAVPALDAGAADGPTDGSDYIVQGKPTRLPGLVVVPGDPTTENIAKWIAEWSTETFKHSVDVKVQETPTNGAGYYTKYNGG